MSRRHLGTCLYSIHSCKLVNQLTTRRPSCLDLFLTPTVCLSVITFDPKGIFQSATLVVTTLLYHLHMIFKVTTKQLTFNFSSPPPWGAEIFFACSARECSPPLALL